MKRIISFILLALLISQLVHSQSGINDVKMTWGEVNKKLRRKAIKEIISQDETGYYILQMKVESNLSLSSIIEHYDINLKRTNSNELSNNIKKNNGNVEFVIEFNKKLYMFWSSKSNPSQRQSLNVSSINKNTLEINNDDKVLVEHKYQQDNQTYDYELSEDYSHLMIYYDLPYGEGQREKLGIHVFDLDLNILWMDNIHLPYKENLFEAKQYKVDDEGNAYLLGLIYLSPPKKRKKEETKYKYHILKYVNNGKELIDYKVHVEDIYITDILIRLTDKQDLICSGFCTEVGSPDKTGCYFLVIDKDTKKNIDKNVEWIGDDFVFKDKHNAKDIAKDKFYCELKEIISLKDNSSVLIGEYYRAHQKDHIYDNEFRGSSTPMFKYADIYIVKINPQGIIEWATIVKKYQDALIQLYSSYLCAQANDNLYFIFSDNPENINYCGKEEPEIFNMSKKSVIMMVEVDSEANQRRKILANVKDVQVFACPKQSKQTSPSELIIVGRKGGTQSLGKLSFED